MSHLTAREEEILRLLEAISSRNLGCVVIGGYAVNAYNIHRFSVDLDLVVSRKNLKVLQDLLRYEGYSEDGSHPELMLRFSKTVANRQVSAELYVDKVICRQTEGVWNHDLIRENAEERRVVGITRSTQALVPKRELLLAMKLHAGRSIDLADVIMLSEEVDWELVARFANTGRRESLMKQLSSAAEIISQAKFASDLRSAFSIRADVPLPLTRATLGIERIKNNLQRA